MTDMLVRIWHLIRGPLQWYVVWLFQHKFVVGVSGVIFDDQRRILLLRHRYWKSGSWGLPGGYVEHKEKLEEALCRELREETGYQIRVHGLLRLVSGYKLRMDASYVGRVIGGDFHLDHKEVIEARFFAVDELPEGLLPSHRDVIALAFAAQG